MLHLTILIRYLPLVLNNLWLYANAFKKYNFELLKLILLYLLVTQTNNFCYSLIQLYQ